MSALRKHRIDGLTSDPRTAPDVDPSIDPTVDPAIGDVVLGGNPAGTEYVTRGARSHRSVRPHLRMVSPLRPERASRGVFAIVVTGVLIIGMVGILLINTSLAQGAFTISELQAEKTALMQEEQALAESVEAMAAPESLEKSAREMGMVPSPNAAFLDVETGKVLGRPKPAPGTRSTMPLLLTPADATAAEGVDSSLAGLPVSADPALDPAAVDAATAQAAANEAAAQAAANEAAAAEAARNADPLAENSLLEETVIIDVTDELASGRGGKVGKGGKDGSGITDGRAGTGGKAGKGAKGGKQGAAAEASGSDADLVAVPVP